MEAYEQMSPYSRGRKLARFGATMGRCLGGCLLAVLLLVGCSSSWTPKRPQRAYTVAAVASPAVAAPQDVGPIPDYDPIATVTTHADVAELVPELPAKLTELLGHRHVVARHKWWTPDPEDGSDGQDDSVIWMRDYQPLFIRDAGGSLLALRYLSENRNRAGYLQGTESLAVRVLPILHENGNLVATRRYVFFAETLFENNAVQLDDPRLLAQGYRPRQREELLKLLSHALRRPVEQLIALPAMPHEATGHIDLFLLPLDDETVMVPSIEVGAPDLGRVPSDGIIAEDIRRFLDERAAQLQALGLTVDRFPMMPPMLEDFSGEDETAGGEGDEEDEQAEAAEEPEPDLLVFTPANSLLINLDGRRLAIVPGFTRFTDNPQHVAVFARYERQWQQGLRARGWEPHMVDSSELVNHLGLLRCVTAVTPAVWRTVAPVVRLGASAPVPIHAF